MTLDIEGVVDRCMGDEESLGLGLGFEPMLLAFSSSDWQVRVLNSVVHSKPARPMQISQIQLIQSGSLRRQAVQS